MHKKYTTVVLVAAAGIFLAALVLQGDKAVPPVACTEEAKLCPDGSAVGRTGPNCAFAACPTVATSTSRGTQPTSGDVVLAVGEKRSVGGLDITFNSVVQDSRCPADVQCIWAGQLIVSVAFSIGSVTEVHEMVLGGAPVVFGGRTIAITNAPAVPSSNVKVGKDYYRLTFNIAATRPGAVGL